MLDPFCGCGTTVDAAEKLGRKWIGIDITHYAITLIEQRLKRHHPKASFTIHGRPASLADAHALAKRDKHQFQWWAAWFTGAQSYREEKRGPDRGIDGSATFANGPFGYGRIIISVKGGENVGIDMVRQLSAVVDREKADMGVLVTLGEPTQPMTTEALGAGIRKEVRARPTSTATNCDRCGSFCRPIAGTAATCRRRLTALSRDRRFDAVWIRASCL